MLSDVPDPDYGERSRSGKEVPQRAYRYSGKYTNTNASTLIISNSVQFHTTDLVLFSLMMSRKINLTGLGSDVDELNFLAAV